MCIHPDFQKWFLLRCDNNNNIITKHSFQDGAPVLRELCKSSGVLPLGFPLNNPFSLFPKNDHYPDPLWLYEVPQDETKWCHPCNYVWLSLSTLRLLHVSLHWFTFNPVYISSYEYIHLSYTAERICLQKQEMWKTWVQFLVQKDLLEKEMAIYSSIIAWKISWTEDPERLQSMRSQRVRHNWAHVYIHTQTCYW